MSIRKLWPVVAAAAIVLASVPAWAAEAAHGGSSSMWWNLLYRTMNFVVLVAVLWWLLRNPIKNMLGGRRESIKAELEELERAKAEAEQALTQAEAKLEDIEAQQEDIIKGYVQAGEAEKAWAVMTRPTKTSMGATAASGIRLYKKWINPKIAPRNNTIPTPNAYPQRPFKRL